MISGTDICANNLCTFKVLINQPSKIRGIYPYVFCTWMVVPLDPDSASSHCSETIAFITCLPLVHRSIVCPLVFFAYWQTCRPSGDFPWNPCIATKKKAILLFEFPVQNLGTANESPCHKPLSIYHERTDNRNILFFPTSNNEQEHEASDWGPKVTRRDHGVTGLIAMQTLSRRDLLRSFQ